MGVILMIPQREYSLLYGKRVLIKGFLKKNAEEEDVFLYPSRSAGWSKS